MVARRELHPALLCIVDVNVRSHRGLYDTAASRKGSRKWFDEWDSNQHLRIAIKLPPKCMDVMGIEPKARGSLKVLAAPSKYSNPFQGRP